MFVGFILSATLCVRATGDAVAHDFHYSRFGLQWNAETGTWQGILRVFTDDLEAALGHGQSEPVMWRLGDEREHPQADDAIAAYAETLPTKNYVPLEINWKSVKDALASIDKPVEQTP